MYERIVVPLDGSDIAEAALPAAIEIARVLGSRIILLNVCNMSKEECDVYQDYLDMQAKKVAGQIERKADTVIVKGNAADEIVNYIDKNKIGLTIMGTHGRSGISQWAIGSVAEKVVREANQPILLMRSQEKCTVSDEGILNRIIVPLDGSERGEAALPYVEEIARVSHGEIVLLHILEKQYHFATAADSYVQIPYTAEEMKPIKAEVQAYLDKVSQRLLAKGLHVRSEMLEGKPAEAIITFSGKTGINMIAISTHGRTGLSRVVFGSVTDKVIHSSCARVLIVRPQSAA